METGGDRGAQTGVFLVELGCEPTRERGQHACPWALCVWRWPPRGTLCFLAAEVKHFHALVHVRFLSPNHSFITSAEDLAFICSFAKTGTTHQHSSQHRTHFPSLSTVFHSEFLSFCGATFLITQMWLHSVIFYGPFCSPRLENSSAFCLGRFLTENTNG